MKELRPGHKEKVTMPVRNLLEKVKQDQDVGIDEEIKDYIVGINCLKDIWTFGSCAGHTVEEIIEHSSEGKKPGRTLYPWVALSIDNPDVYWRFCQEVAPVGDSSSPALTLWTGTHSMQIEPPPKGIVTLVSGSHVLQSVPSEKLAEVRQLLFQCIINALAKVITEDATDEEMKLKAAFLKPYITTSQSRIDEGGTVMSVKNPFEKGGTLPERSPRGIKVQGSGKLKIGPVEIFFDNRESESDKNTGDIDSLVFDSLDLKQLNDIMEETNKEIERLNARLEQIRQSLQRRK